MSLDSCGALGCAQNSSHYTIEDFEFVQMPFGLWNAAQTFQGFMDQVLHGSTFVYNYIDDLLITSKDSEEYKTIFVWSLNAFKIMGFS